jgi:hypothetical protein
MQDAQTPKMTHVQARVKLSEIIAQTDGIPIADVSGQSPISHRAFQLFHANMGSPARKYWFSSMPASRLLSQFEFEHESA